MACGCAKAADSAELPEHSGGNEGTSTSTSSSGGSSGTGSSKSGGAGGKSDSAGGGTAVGGSGASTTHAGTGGTTSSIPTSTKLRVKFHTYSPTQLTFILENTDSDPYRYVPLASLRLRYWFTPEGALSKYTTRCDQVDTRGNALKCSNIVLEIGDADPPYLDISFDVVPTWRLWGTDSISRLNVALMNDNTQGTQPDLTNDYSYLKTTDYTLNDKVAIYQDGVLAWGEEPAGATTASGGSGTGGAAATGGTEETGGAATGGAQATGGTATGGAATGGASADAAAGANDSAAGARADSESAGTAGAS